MSASPTFVRATRGLLSLLAGLWLIFGLVILAGSHPSYREPDLLRWGVAAGGLVVGLALTLLTTMLRPGRPLVFWLLVALLAAMLVVGLLDELGLADIVYLGLTAVPLAVILKDRARYMRGPEPTD
jgi:hypothetical protein